jgi:glycerol-3-phosphate acyltransferase PlsX
MVDLEGITVALDAMGGDNAPEAMVDGAMAAEEELGVKVLLVGRRDVLEGVLARKGAWSPEILHAGEIIGMEEDGARAVRRKKNASVVAAAEAVREGKAQAMVSAGNTGAAMAAAFFAWGRIRGVKRPAVAVVLPPRESPVLLVDAGANSDCRPEHLREFALMGAAYARCRWRMERPRVGLLNIGEEEGKGNELAREAYSLLKNSAPVDFVGNVEGRDLAEDKADVVVTDGFTGNVALKTIEGTASFILSRLLRVLREVPREHLEPLLPALAGLREELDYRATGGAPLLGVKGVCIIAHGSSDAVAVKNSIREAAETVATGLVHRLEEAMASEAGRKDEDQGKDEGN